MSNTPEFDAPQLAAARAAAWHQNGDPLLPLDAVRAWLTATGLVLFAPRPLQLPAPAPSLVEATLGASSGGPTAAQLDTARSLAARLIAEGNALPLNLLGAAPAAAAADTPDFMVSAQVFSYVYTLRGDKLWKQPPTSCSPLGLRVFEVLGEKGALSAAEIAAELGRELTEAAVLRSLHELWSNLRVIPLLQQGNESKSPTLWELTSRRFTKAIKAGINAGQPTALSALISLYLAQALLATEDEIETFLSPLAARSRIREVVHALNGSRQLETIVLEGKSLLYIPGTLPQFAATAKPEAAEAANSIAGDAPFVTASSSQVGSTGPGAAPGLEGEGRIKKFTAAKAGKTISDFKGKPARSFGAGASSRPSRPARPATGRAAGARSTSRFAGKSDRPFAARPDSERRPFRRDAADGAAASAAARPSFTKPWKEDRKPEDRKRDDSKPRDRKPAGRKTYMPRPDSAGTASRRPYVRREISAAGEGFAKRPYTPRSEADGAAPKRPYARREGSAPGAGFTKRPYTPREGASSDRPARPAFGAKRPFGDKPSFGAKRSFGDKPAFGAKRPFGDKPAFGAKRPFGDKPAFGAKRAFSGKPRSERSAAHAAPEHPDAFAKFRKPAPESRKPVGPAYGGSDSQPRAPKRPFPRKEGDLADRPIRPWVNRPDPATSHKSGGFAKRSAGGKFGGKTGFSKRPSGFKPGVKPGFKPAGGFKPVARKPKPEAEE